MHKVPEETVRLFDSSRINIVDAEKMREAVDTIYNIVDGEEE
jgi:hypothetical protein